MIKTYYIEGMSCTHCEHAIRKKIKKLLDLKIDDISHEKGYIIISSNNSVLNDSIIIDTIESAGYSVVSSKKPIPYKSILVVIGALLIIKMIPETFLNYLPTLNSQASLGLVFLVGVLTSLHCLTMCGGIALMSSGNNSNKALKNSIKYNVGRILSYSLLGGIVGAIGSIFTISNSTKSYFLIFIGIAMLYMGLSMAGILTLPKFVKNQFLRISQTRGKFKSNSSFVIGILNGFMPCGPLQTMQLYALGTMSFTKGATAMFIFALGTTPLMLGFGSLRQFLSKKLNSRIMHISGLTIIIFALLMINRGLLWNGYSIENTVNDVVIQTTQEIEEPKINYAEIVDGYQIVNMEVNRFYDIENVVVKKDIPVKININAITLTPCIDTITIPRYDVVKGLVGGHNEIIFTPNTSEELVITCWMAMVTTTLEVE